MRVGFAAFVPLCAALALPDLSSASPSAAPRAGRAAGRPTVSFEILTVQAALGAARAAWNRARWGGSLDSLQGAQLRLECESNRYRSALRSAPLPVRLSPKQIAEWIPVALDLAEAGEWQRALQLLRGPLSSERSLLALHARAAARVSSPAAGLEVLGWPPHRRGREAPAEPVTLEGRARKPWTAAELFVASTLSDSAGWTAAARSARWLLFDDRRPAAARIWARRSLARELAERGERRLSIALLSRDPARTTRETILLADLTAASGDSAAAARLLIAVAARSDLPTSDRYAAARRAAGWLFGAVSDSLAEGDWLSLLRSLADVGEAPLALQVMSSRRTAPADSAAGERAELRASLLSRARRYDAATDAYRVLLARGGLTPTARAEYALGWARSARAARNFPAMDSAFVLAATLDSAGAVGESAAWERAREWEDRKSPREAAPVLRWARTRVRTASLAAAIRVHEAIAWVRADSLAAADAALAPPAPDDPAVFFWRGWLAAAGRDSARARQWFRRAWESDPWSYEGVRARELAGLAVDPAQGATGARVRHETRIAAAPPLESRVLDLVGFDDLALQELRACATGEAEPLAFGCIDALEERGVYRVGRTGQDSDLRLRFPPAHPGAVFRAAREESLSAPLIWSIMRRESGYNASARSRAGALGLLQLLQSTASRLARRTVPEDSLLDPDLNVRLGTRYLRALVREFGDSRAASAAYNAGEEAARRWVAARPTIDDLWVELIPYRETRDYVKQIYAAMRRYEAVYDAAPTR